MCTFLRSSAAQSSGLFASVNPSHSLATGCSLYLRPPKSEKNNFQINSTLNCLWMSYLLANSRLFDLAEALQWLENVRCVEGTAYVLEVWAIERLCHFYEYLFIVVHEIKYVRQQLIPCSFNTECYRDRVQTLYWIYSILIQKVNRSVCGQEVLAYAIVLHGCYHMLWQLTSVFYHHSSARQWAL